MQERLADYIVREAVDSEKQLKKVRLVMSVDNKMFSQIQKKLLVNVPVVCEVPSWIGK